LIHNGTVSPAVVLALARNTNLPPITTIFLILMARFCGRRCSNPRKIYWSLVGPHDLGALETKAGHQTLLWMVSVPICQPRVLFTQSTALWFIKKKA
jgi:hypothetical protein